MNLEAAVHFIRSHGSPIEQARLRYMLEGLPAPSQIVAQLLAGQRPDGGWAPFWAADYSSLDASCFRLSQARQLGVQPGHPAVRQVLQMFVRRQQAQGFWEEEVGVADLAPPWVKPGDLACRLYLTSNCAYWLALLDPQGAAAGRAAAYLQAHLDSRGNLPAFAQAHWLAGGLWRLLGWSGPAGDVLKALEPRLEILPPSSLAWCITALLDAGLPSNHPLLQAAVARLESRQQADGRWQDEDGAAQEATITLEAVCALHLARLPSRSLAPFFAPKGVAVVGATADPTKLGYGLARNLVQSNYPGVVHFVNPRRGSLMGRPIYATVLEVPDPVDLAALLIPAGAVPQTLRECGERGIQAAMIMSGGFRETGPQGAALETECLQIARAFGMRLMGPNCVGLVNTHLPLDTTFLPPPGPLPGDVAFISHSGAICAAVIDWARGQGFGLSRLISLGNQADVNETDVLAPTAADPFTRVLTLYLEGVSAGRRFVEEAGRVTRHKPIIALKVGRFASGQRAVASHTGALAGRESAFNAAFRRAGVIRAETSEEMFDWARALAWCAPPAGRGMAVLTNAGGPGVTAADALEANGLHLASLAPETRSALEALLPAAASLHNPVDMLAAATPEQYAACLRILLEDPAVHGVLVILPPPPMHTAGAVAKTLIPVVHSVTKPVVIALMGEKLIQEAVEHFRAARVPEYRFPERAASALAILAKRAEFLQQAQHPAPLPQDLDPQQVRAVLKDAIRDLDISGSKQARPDSQVLETSQVYSLLAAYGIPVSPVVLALSSEDAVQAARKLGFPVALKVASADIEHKSDVGGVLLDLADIRAVADGFIAVTYNARRARPAARIEGVHVQRIVPPGQEVIIGAVQDEHFGALVMFGAGGVEVEGLKDVAFGLAPLDREEAAWMVGSTWAGRKLDGYRNLPPADREAVLDVLLRLSHLAADFPELVEIEINPLRVLPAGQGVVAIDARARLKV